MASLNYPMNTSRSDVGAKSRVRQWIDDDIAFWRRIRRWRQEHPTNLFTASVLALVALATAAIILWFGLARVLADRWPRELVDPGISQYSVIRMVLFVLAGAVGVIGVVVAYRRQHGIEEGRFLERLAEASRLLGDQNPTVQAAGVYALAGLADAEGLSRRQQCVDVLCAYIRLPYTSASEGHELEALMNIKRTLNMNTPSGVVEEEQTRFRPHDQHTRETIIRVIAQHLREDARVSWSDPDLDFTGAVFDYGDFSGAVFSGNVSFKEARFIGGRTSFREAHFADGVVRFSGAQFAGSLVDFQKSLFTGGTVYFISTKVSEGRINFARSVFSGGNVRFDMTEFTGGWLGFANVLFVGSEVDFNGAKFMGTHFTFFRAMCTDGHLSFNRARFGGSHIRFNHATFAGGLTTFGLAEFADGIVDANLASFAGGTVDFDMPRTWHMPPRVPWKDGEQLPSGVKPLSWPPDLHRRVRVAEGS